MTLIIIRTFVYAILAGGYLMIAFIWHSRIGMYKNGAIESLHRLRNLSLVSTASGYIGPALASIWPVLWPWILPIMMLHAFLIWRYAGQSAKLTLDLSNATARN